VEILPAEFLSVTWPGTSSILRGSILFVPLVGSQRSLIMKMDVSPVWQLRLSSIEVGVSQPKPSKAVSPTNTP
jgi:hypothetical protein